MYRFTPRDAGFSLFLLDKDTRDDAASDEPYATVPIWRTPWIAPLNDTVQTVVVGFGYGTITDLVQRTIAVHDKHFGTL